MLKYFITILLTFNFTILTGQIGPIDKKTIDALKQLDMNKNDIKKLMQTNPNLVPQIDEGSLIDDYNEPDKKNNTVQKEEIENLYSQEKTINTDQENKEDEKLSNQNEKIENSVKPEPSNDLYFGYNTFFNDPEIFDKSISEAATLDYIVGPGDEIIIMLWGETELNEPYIISKEGYLFINNIGQVYVNGLSLFELEKKLFKILKK